MDKIYAMHRCKKAEKFENSAGPWRHVMQRHSALHPLSMLECSPGSLGIERHSYNQCVEVSVIGFMVFW